MSGVVEPFETIEVQSTATASTGCLTSIHILPDDRLLVTEFNDRHIQLFDSSNKLIARADLAGPPDDLAIVNCHECVVSIRTMRLLQFVAIVKDSLVPGKAVETDGTYCGVAYCQHQLIVADVSANRIKVLNMEGRVLSTIGQIFAKPWYIAANKMENVIYVADYDAGTVTCMTMEGTVLSVYKWKPKCPLGITVHPDGTVYVCDYCSHSIHHITSQCTYIETFLSNGEVKKPRAVGFNPAGDRMYLSEDGANRTKVLVYTLDSHGTPSQHGVGDRY